MLLCIFFVTAGRRQSVGTIQEILNNNFISIAMIIGIAIMIMENRKENPQGTDHIAVIMVLLSIIVVNTAMKDWYMS